MASTVPPPPPGRPSSLPPGRSSFGPPSVAFLGTGALAISLATSVAKKGFPLTTWNRLHDKTTSLLDLGAKPKSSPKECVAGARVIVMLLENEQDVLDVLSREDGVLGGMDPDAVVADMSPTGRGSALQAASLVRQAGGRFIDAPLSEPIVPTATADLVALVGGKLNDVSRAQPVLLAMCKRIIHAGDVGQGQALRVLLSGVGAHHLVALVSMLVLGDRAGIGRRVLLDAFTSGAFATPSYVARADSLLSKDYLLEFPLEAALQDARRNVDLQQEVGLPLPVHREVTRAIEKAVDDGLGAEDVLALEKYYRSL